MGQPMAGQQRWRKRPVEIEAVRLQSDNGGQIVAWIDGNGGNAVLRGGPGGGSADGTVMIATLEGQMVAEQGDWIICGVKGEFYPCKPDIFEATYVPGGSPPLDGWQGTEPAEGTRRALVRDVLVNAGVPGPAALKHADMIEEAFLEESQGDC